MDEDLRPLTPDLDAFLDAERRYPDAPAGVRARVLARVAATIGMVGSAPATAGLATALLARPVLLALGTLALGVVVAGIGVKYWNDPAPEPGARPGLPVAGPSVHGSSSPVVSHSEPRPLDVAPSPAAVAAERRPEPRPARRASSGDELEAERIMLQRARAQLAAGDGKTALGAIERHARRFPGGALVEEREALAVRALLLTANHEAARARGAQFRRRYPQSIYLPAVEQALESIP